MEIYMCNQNLKLLNAPKGYDLFIKVCLEELFQLGFTLNEHYDSISWNDFLSFLKLHIDSSNPNDKFKFYEIYLNFISLSA